MSAQHSLPLYFGCHVSSSGGLVNALRNGKTLGINTIQLHPSPPQRWNSKAFPEGAETEFVAERAASGIEKVFFHGIYLINLATANLSQLQMARVSLLHYLDLNARLNGDGVIFHVGSNKDQPDEKSGFQQAAEAINWVMERSENNAKLILEVAAGAGAIVGDRMEELAQIYEHVKVKDRVGFGLDSQHLWASGYDLKNDLEGFMNNAKSVLGFDKIWSIHLNDSKTECGSKKDRHENLGDGLIGYEGIRAFFTRSEFHSIPFILETPAMKDLESAATEVEKLRAMGDAKAA